MNSYMSYALHIIVIHTYIHACIHTYIHANKHVIIRTQRQLRIPHPDGVTCVTFTPDGLILGTACSDGRVRLHETRGEWLELVRYELLMVPGYVYT